MRRFCCLTRPTHLRCLGNHCPQVSSAHSDGMPKLSFRTPMATWYNISQLEVPWKSAVSALRERRKGLCFEVVGRFRTDHFWPLPFSRFSASGIHIVQPLPVLFMMALVTKRENAHLNYPPRCRRGGCTALGLMLCFWKKCPTARPCHSTCQSVDGVTGTSSKTEPAKTQRQGFELVNAAIA